MLMLYLKVRRQKTVLCEQLIPLEKRPEPGLTPGSALLPRHLSEPKRELNSFRKTKKGKRVTGRKK